MATPDHSVRGKLTAHCRRHTLLRAGDRLGVAVSGGADSVALLRLLLELRADFGLVLSVVHFNHGIRGEASDADAAFVRTLANTHGLPFHLGGDDVPRRAREWRLSLEAAARRSRYACFRQLIADGEVSKVATAHTLDDQAETVLLRLIRGAGTRGLAGIYPRISIPDAPSADAVAAPDLPPGEGATAEIVRPLLTVSRCEVERYLVELGQAWREDASNQDLRHTRNRVRHRLLPLLEQEFNPSIRQVLADTAEIARAEEAWWGESLAAAPSPLIESPHAVMAVNIEQLLASPLALRRRTLRQLLERFRIPPEAGSFEALLNLAELPNGSRLELPGHWLAVRASAELPASSVAPGTARARAERLADGRWRVPVLLLQTAAALAATGDFAYPFPVPGSIFVPELRVTFTALMTGWSAEARAYNPCVLSAGHAGELLEVRNWRPGDRFHPGSAKSVHKVKELLQSKRISGPERAAWPVIVNAAGELLWMRGFPVPGRFAPASDAAEGILIEERGS